MREFGLKLCLFLFVTSPIVLPDWKHSLAADSSTPGSEAESAVGSVRDNATGTGLTS
mgnify:CR=1 FL=1